LQSRLVCGTEEVVKTYCALRVRWSSATGIEVLLRYFKGMNL